MRVAFYTTTVLEQGGGLEKYFIDVSFGLSQYKNIDVDIITMSEDVTLKVNRLLRFYYFKKQNTSMTDVFKEPSSAVLQKLGNVRYHKCKNFKELKQKLSEYDIIYSKNELLEAFILKFFIGYRNLPPIIFGCHTPVYYPVADSLQSKLHNFLYNGFVYKWIASGVKAFHVANEFDKKLLSGIFPKKEVFMIHNPFNFLQFETNLKSSIFDFKFNALKYNILWIARLTEQKGVLSLVKIIDKLNNSNLRDSIVFNIVGSGQLEGDIVKIQKKWDNVNWFGYVEYRYLPSIYSQNNLFLSTSKWESLPFNILEAQATGLPVVAFDIPGPKDIIQNKETGFLVKNEKIFCEKVSEIAGKKKTFNSKQIKVRTRKLFNPQDIYSQLMMLFDSIAKNSR